MGKFISGLPTRNSLDRWHTYAKQNSYHPDRAQLRNDLSGKDATKDVNEMPKLPKHRREEGQGWSDMKATTADNAYTGKDGSKRD